MRITRFLVVAVPIALAPMGLALPAGCEAQTVPGRTTYEFQPGHRMRVEIASSNFPRFDRNLNTGGNNYDEAEWVVADNVIHHSVGRESYLVMPVGRR